MIITAHPEVRVIMKNFWNSLFLPWVTALNMCNLRDMFIYFMVDIVKWSLKKSFFMWRNTQGMLLVCLFTPIFSSKLAMWPWQWTEQPNASPLKPDGHSSVWRAGVQHEIVEPICKATQSNLKTGGMQHRVKTLGTSKPSYRTSHRQAMVTSLAVCVNDWLRYWLQCRIVFYLFPVGFVKHNTKMVFISSNCTGLRMV